MGKMVFSYPLTAPHGKKHPYLNGEGRGIELPATAGGKQRLNMDAFIPLDIWSLDITS